MAGLAHQLFMVSAQAGTRRGRAGAKNDEQSIGSALPMETDRVAVRRWHDWQRGMGDLERARELWEGMRGDSREGYEAYEQLAIYYEHDACTRDRRSRPPVKALASFVALATDVRDSFGQVPEDQTLGRASALAARTKN